MGAPDGAGALARKQEPLASLQRRHVSLEPKVWKGVSSRALQVLQSQSARGCPDRLLGAMRPCGPCCTKESEPQCNTLQLCLNQTIEKVRSSPSLHTERGRRIYGAQLPDAAQETQQTPLLLSTSRLSCQGRHLDNHVRTKKMVT